MAFVEGKRDPGVPAQAGIKWARRATEEYGAELRKAHGPQPTRKYGATEPRLGRTTPDNQGPPPNNMSQPVNIAHTAPGTKTPAAGKPNNGAALVTLTDEQGRGLPSDTLAEVAAAEDSGASDDGVTPTKKRAADGTGKQVQQRLQFSAKKSEQNKAKARFAKDGSQNTAPSATKKGVQLVVEKQDMHYVNVECKSAPSASPKRQSRRPWSF